MKRLGKFALLLTWVSSTLSITACSKNDSHLPSPLDLPGVIGSVFENASYQAKRKKVAAYVNAHYLAIREDVLKGGGKNLEGVFDVAGIKPSRRAAARKMMENDRKQIFQNALTVSDSLINVFASLYVNERKNKEIEIHGFKYIDAKMLIQNYANANFEALRLAIKNGQGPALDHLLLKLDVKDAGKQTIFKKKAQALYNAIYIDPVVVAVMVNT